METEETKLSDDIGKTSEKSEVGANRPDFRVVQPDHDQSGKTVFKSVGGMWKSVSKNGNEFYTLKIGELKLLVFPNDRK